MSPRQWANETSGIRKKQIKAPTRYAEGRQNNTMACTLHTAILSPPFSTGFPHIFLMHSGGCAHLAIASVRYTTGYLSATRYHGFRIRHALRAEFHSVFAIANPSFTPNGRSSFEQSESSYTPTGVLHCEPPGLALHARCNRALLYSPPAGCPPAIILQSAYRGGRSPARFACRILTL